MPLEPSSTNRSRLIELSPLEGLEPYLSSSAARKARASQRAGLPLRIACLDIDSTLTGDDRLVDSVRSQLESAGYVVVFDTSRTEEMLMSTAAFEASVGLRRPPPLLGGAAGEHRFVPPETAVPAGLLDGDILAASTGTRILVKAGAGGYVPDLDYEARYGAGPRSWRDAAEALLHQARDRGCAFEMAPIESERTYQMGGADVAPPLYRIQLNFSDLGAKTAFLQCMQDLMPGSDADVVITDDSKPDTMYKVFLSPRGGSKVRAITHIARCLMAVTDIAPNDVSLFFAGDSFPDLKMGLLGVPGAAGNFLLVGGSRLVDVLLGRETHFAGEALDAFRRRLEPTGREGYFTFRAPFHGWPARTLILGDLAFPGTTTVQTVEAFLETAL